MTVRLAGLVCLGCVASLVVVVPRVTRRVTGRLSACLWNDLSACVRRRRSGARCWLDQELVRPLGVTHYRPAAAVSLASDRHHRTLRASRRIESDACRRAGLRDRCRHPPRRARLGGRELRPLVPLSLERRRLRTRAAIASCFALLIGTRPAGVPGRSRARGSYGAGLARFLAGRGEAVLEVSRTPRTERRLRGKDDALDAARTARAVLASETLALPRAGERREALRLLLVARRSAVDVRREALTQLRAVIVTAPERLRQELRELPLGKLLERCSRLRRTSSASTDELATRLVLRSLARRIQAATLEADELEREILAHVRALAPAAARRARRRPDRRCTTDRRLVTPRPAPLRSLLRPPRRRRTHPRLKRPNQPAPAQPRRRPPTQPRPPHDRPAPPPTRPSDQGLHRATHRRRQEHAATPPASSSATSPATSTDYSNNRPQMT